MSGKIPYIVFSENGQAVARFAKTLGLDPAKVRFMYGQSEDIGSGSYVFYGVTQGEVDAALSSFNLTTSEDVNTEAGERILSEFPIHKQLNAQARASELILKGPANWTEAEAVEAFWLQAAREWIKSVRAASETLSANPPANYKTSDVWPASFAETAAAIIEAQATE